jgi:chaperonin GroEL (HSP60 family)
MRGSSTSRNAGHVLGSSAITNDGVTIAKETALSVYHDG